MNKDSKCFRRRYSDSSEDTTSSAMSTGKIYHKKVKILPLGGDPVLDKDLAEKDFGSEQGHGQRRFCYGGGSSGREYSVVVGVLL